MKTVKRIAALFALMFTAAAWAVDAPLPVALWNGDFDETEKGAYTLSANGNTVAADGSTITIAVGSTKGVKITLPTNAQEGSVIVKYSNLTPTASDTWALMTMGGGNNTQDSNVDIMGACCVGVSRSASGVWDRKRWTNKDSGAGNYSESGTMAYVYKYNDVARGYANGALIYTADKNLQGSAVYLKHFGIGGKQSGLAPANGTDVTPAIGMKVEAIAVFGGKLTDAEIAAYEFPKVAKKVEPIALINFGYTTEEDGWYNYHQNGGHDLGPVTTNGVSFSATKDIGNFFYTSNTDFGEVNTDFAGNGTYADIFGVEHATIQEEIKTSLGLSGIDFTTAVYKSGQMNGGQTDHAVSISGLDATAKYVVYAGFGMLRTQYNEQVMGVQIDASGYSTVDALEYVTTVAGQNATVATSYQTFTAGTVLKCGSQGLMVVRLKNVMPKADGSVAFTFKGDKGGINFLAVAKVNDVEEPEETVTTNYNFNKFLTDSYQDTGWSVTLEEILGYGLFTGAMDGNYVSGNNVPAQGFHKKTGVDGSVSVVEFQMQIYQEGSSASDKYLKATRVYAKEQGGTIWLRAVSSGNVQYGTLGTEITNWNGTLAKAADQAGYGVASVALAITKPVDKSVKGTIGVVTTAHSEDYSSNTITAAVSIENAGEYKGAAVLVYILGETQYVAEIEDGSASITVEDLEREKVYRGTLALGQKIDETVTVIEGTELPVALYQGERKYTWMASPIVIKKATTINSGEGCTAPVPTDMPDYVENCDSVFTVSISAAEAVSEENDTESLEGVQGGVRIAEVGGALKLQVVKNGVWTVFSNAEIDKTYAMTVTFHYAKDENDTDPAVSYVLDKTTETSAKMTDKTKVTEVFIADGTVLPDDLTGLFQFDSAVVVDIELKPGEGDLVEYSSKEAAEAALGNLKIGICDAVKSVLKTEEQQSTYRSYFYLAVVPSAIAKDGFAVKTELKSDITTEIEKDIAEAMAKVVEGFNTGSAEIAAKPGLYYGVKRGDSLDAMNTVETEMATSEKVTITITKPDNAKQHFYRIIVSPTPASNK